MRACLAVPLLAVAMGGCQSPVLLPGAVEAPVVVPQEAERLEHRAAQVEEALRRRGLVRDDPAATAYLQALVDRLYPGHDGRIRVGILASPELNAFALPNGAVYLNLGMLARVENEAQLATILAHEAAHVTGDHALLQARTLKSGTALATVLGMAGLPVLGDLAAISSIYGFSRELERDADREGFHRLVVAGYSSGEAERTFRHLLDELEALEIDEPLFFSSHPRLRERIESFRELAVTVPPGAGTRLGTEAFLEATAAARLAALEADLAHGRHGSVILVLEDPRRQDRYPPFASYYLGEAYRLRGRRGDARRAVAAWEQAVARAPAFAPSYRALGMHHLKAGAYHRARAALERYLALAPEAPDRLYVEQYLADIDVALGPA